VDWPAFEECGAGEGDCPYYDEDFGDEEDVGEGLGVRESPVRPADREFGTGCGHDE